MQRSFNWPWRSAPSSSRPRSPGGPVLAAQRRATRRPRRRATNRKSRRGGHPAEESANPLKPEPTLAIWTLAVFVLLMTVLGKFAWKPLIHALHEREKHLEHVLHETERARNESESLLSEHRKQMASAADEVRELLEEARADAQRTAEISSRAGRGRSGQAARQRESVLPAIRPWPRSGRRRPTWRYRSPDECFPRN